MQEGARLWGGLQVTSIDKGLEVVLSRQHTDGQDSLHSG